MKKIVLQSIVMILGIAVGGAAGGYRTFQRYAREYQLVRGFAWAGIFLAVSENQFDQNSGDARQELLNTLDLYQRGAQSSQIDPVMKKALRMNCGLIEARLSVLENEAGSADRAQSYMLKAQEDLKAVGWLDSSEANILQAVRRRPVSPCGRSSQSATKEVAPAREKPCG